MPPEKRRGNLTSLNTIMKEVGEEIDRSAARQFSLYSEQAQTNGYGLQAHLVDTKERARVTMLRDEITAMLETFDRDVPGDIKKFIPKRWNWKEQAKVSGMGDEYDFIYSYTSRLLHATPASITTNEKNLSLIEIEIFLKYIRVRLLDAIEMAEQLRVTISQCH